ncbi:TonB-dependent receptor [Marinifilum flexuosum]|uniref:Iron complex outermembrane receptor protein n=1 Tax=Marinifilum flexuosum TaxID=1117708 RepID=A0A419WWG8_9BACT|nr:TonB-dependent receptor [Marinifilum flexuosum]RKD99823.1 iron complex outermembrane receptor protein [Marinifilum flexuosum]
MLKRVSLLLITLLCLPAVIWAQQSLKGFVLDKDSGKPIEGANLYLKELKQGTSSLKDGSFHFPNIKAEEYLLSVSFVGYEDCKLLIDTRKASNAIKIEIKRNVTILDGVNISAQAVRETEQVVKLAAPLKDIPLTTSSVGQDLIKQTGVNSIHEALKYTTGVKPLVNYGGFQTFTMRGFGAPVIMLDGVRDERMNFSNSAPFTSLAAVERIEFLKGPASVLYGHTAVGGILNVVRKQPTKDFHANFSASYGSWNTTRVELGAGNKISDKLSYRFDAGFSNTDGWRDAEDKTLNGYLALNYEMSENDLFEFRIAGNNDTYGTETGLPSVKYDVFDTNDNLLYKQGELPTTFDRSQRYNDPADFLDHENWNTSIKYTRKLSENSKLQVHTAYSDDLIDYFSTEELSYLTSDNAIYDSYYMKGDAKKYICLDSLQRTFPLRFSHETKTFQNTIDFSTKFDLAGLEHNFNAGYFYMYIDRKSYSGYSVGTDVTGEGLFAKIAVVNPVLYQGDLETKFSKVKIYNENVHGLFFQDLVSVSSKVKVLLGARYDRFDMGNQSAKVMSGRNISDKTGQKSIINHSLTYRLGTVYQPSENLSLYASYANFFKPKRTVFNENYIYLDKDGKEFTPTNGKEVFEPEDGYQLEAGFKYQSNAKLHINGSVYYIKKNNIVEYLGKSDEDKRIYGQVGVIDSKGFDLELNYKPFDNLSFIGGYGFNIAKYRKFSDNAYQNSKEGNYIRNNPKNHVFAWAYYNLPENMIKGLSLGFGMDYNDKMYVNSSNSYSLPRYFLFDASIDYRKKNFYGKLKANNLFDQNYYSSTVYSNQYIPGMERNFTLTVGMDI